MGNGGSSQPVTASSDEVVHLGHQLFVVLKMNKPDNQPWPLDFVPHVVGSLPIIGGWDEAKAIALERESTSAWELSFVVPGDHGSFSAHTSLPCWWITGF